MSSGKSRQALGKGLGALIPGAGSARAAARDYFECPIERIYPQEDQPRKVFDQAALDSLAESIRTKGVIQPVVVRRRKRGNGFELITGERRWRAAQLAGLKVVPVVIKDATPLEAFELALVENLQREDLNAIEEAEGYHRLIDEHERTQAEIARLVGKNRSTIANSLRLLSLPVEVRAMVTDGVLTEGHARAVLQAGTKDKMITLAKLAAARSLSVRETERRARALAAGKKATESKRKNPQSANVRRLVTRLQRALGARVRIADKKGTGRLEIDYTSYEELDRILDKILK